MFESLTKDIPLNEIPIVHITASDATALYPKLPYVNGCRFGIMMYGFSQDKNISLASTFTVISEVLQIQTSKKGIPLVMMAYIKLKRIMRKLRLLQLVMRMALQELIVVDMFIFMVRSTQL